MVEYLAWTISSIAMFLLVASAIAFARARDVFTMAHVVMIANCYLIPLLLIGIAIEKFSYLSFAKIIALIMLNLVVVNLLCHAIVRRSAINKVTSHTNITN